MARAILTGSRGQHGRKLAWVLAAAGMALLPHLSHLPIWVSVFTAATAWWRYEAHRRRWRMPPALLRMILALACFAGVFATYKGVNGIRPGTALLTLMVALKFTETRLKRDYVVLVFSAYFLIVAQLLYEQSMWAAAWAVPSVWVATTALLQVTRDAPSLAPATALRISGTLLAHAVPVMLVLFVLFPRVPGPFWGLDAPTASGVTGLSDSMELGSISQLIESDAVAFRVSFDGPVPLRSQLYWRGPVLHAFDGRRWTPGLERAAPGLRTTSSGIRPRGSPVRYQVTLEPHHRRWLLALDLPLADSLPPQYAELRFDHQAIARSEITELTSYDLISFPDAVADLELDPAVRKAALGYPRSSAQRAIALGQSWRREHDSELDVVQRALSLFREQPFTYTLRPPRLDDDPVDEFLFDTRRGFCEHFASAFVVLMRGAGIPARVVTGYMGGEINTTPYLGGYLSVLQSDAHAWAEVWLAGRGWVRLDPTGWVAPDRIEYGLDQALPAGERARGRLLRFNPLFNRLRYGWDALTNTWNEWVLGFDDRKQAELLQSFGMRNPTAFKMTAVLGVLLVAFGLALSLYLTLTSRPHAHDPAVRLYQRFCRKLARRATLARAAHEGPASYARRVCASRPELRSQIRAITDLYVRLRYQPGRSEDDLRQLRKLVHAFHP